MAYLTGAEFLQRYDARTVGDLVQDTGARVTTNLATDTNLLAMIADASGWVESACYVGNRYTSADLTALTGSSAALLKRLVADISFAFLRQRRGYDLEQFPLVQESFNMLDRLRLGERVFDIAAVKDAGNASATTTSKQTILSQNLLRDNTRYFNVRHWTQYQ